jgi:hypothetical protein
MTDPARIASVVARMIDLASEGCTGVHDSACCDHDFQRPPTEWCKRCLMGFAASQLTTLMGEIAEAREECPCVRQDRFADASLLTAVREEVSRSFLALPVAAPQAQGWQDIATAPTKQWVLVYFARFKNCAVLQRNPNGNWSDEDDAVYTSPSHWMPLPTLPSGAQEPPRSQP